MWESKQSQGSKPEHLDHESEIPINFDGWMQMQAKKN
jgi:hypothetical protein